MSTLLVTSRDCLKHDTGAYHPERADRLKVIHQVLEGEAFVFLHREEAKPGDVDLIKRVHDPDYVDHVLSHVPEEGHHNLDSDTVLSPGSGQAALVGVGGICQAVDAVMSGPERNAFVAVRPPGHHAERNKAMGFCLFNNAAVGAFYAREKYGAERVVVMDWDVHHGNGTQDIFEHDPDMFYISTHQWPLYPGTGAPEERGMHGNILNVPLESGAGTDELQKAFNSAVLPAIRNFNPDLLIISAGFDAHANDPLAGLNFTVSDFIWMTEQLLNVASECCDNRVVSVLEGGYELAALGGAVGAHVRTLMTA